jgi:predicted RNA-binding Zn-ribbon protein involved in translation (DUF1610 family)
MEKEYCPECRSELQLTVAAYFVKYSCPVCGKYEKIETMNSAKDGRVVCENWSKSLKKGRNIYKGRELD